MGRNPLTKASPVASMGRGAEKGAAAASSEITGGLVRLLPPWVTAAALPPAAWLCERLWATGDAAAWAAMGMTAITAGLSALAWRLSHARRLVGRVHITANVALSLGWVTVATISGPFERPVIDVWVLGSFGLALAWNLRSSTHKDTAEDDPLAGFWKAAAEKTGLTGSRMRAKELTADRAVGALQLAPGQTADDVTKARQALAVMAGTPATGVRTTPDPDDAGRLEVTFVRRDLLRETRVWSGPKGGTAVDPIEFGTYEDGVRFAYTLPAVPGVKNASQVGISGKNGAGKSGIPLIAAAEFLVRAGCEVWVIDTVKRLQTFGPIADLLDWFEIEKAGGRKMIAHLRAAVRSRSDHLGARGLSDWVPGCGLSLLLVVIEEGADFDLEEVVRLNQQTRSLGIVVMTSAQRWSFDNVPTSLRAEITAAFAFGADSAADAEFLLGDLVEQGADPGVWGTDHPGKCYAKAVGVPADRQTLPLRLDYAHPAEVNRLTRPHALPPALDEVTANATPAYAARTRWPEGGSTAEGWTPPTSIRSTAPVVEGTVTDHDDDDQFTPSEPDLDPDVQPGIDDEIRDGDTVIPFPRGTARGPEASAEQARQALDQFIAARREARQTFAPRDVRPLGDRLGKKRGWVMHELRRRVEAGELVQLGDGSYQAHDTALADA